LLVISLQTGRSISERARLQDQIECIGVGRAFAQAARLLDLDHADAKPNTHPRHDLFLSGGQFSDLLVEPVRPEIRAGFA
jgi:hypothetical protein